MDKNAAEHPEIDFVFKDAKGKEVDWEHAVPPAKGVQHTREVGHLVNGLQRAVIRAIIQLWTAFGTSSLCQQVVRKVKCRGGQRS